MTTEPTTEVPALTNAGEIIAEFRRMLARGDQHWFLALLHAVRQWPLPAETAGGREYRYLVAGEAFDWLLLAERLLGEVDGLVPEEEAEALLCHSTLPLNTSEDELQRLLGAKAAAYRNFYYGVRVEEGLQLAVEAEVLKERQSRVWENGHLDDEVCNRIYGSTRRALFALYQEKAGPARPEVSKEREEDGRPGDAITLAGLNEFTYWLFKYRVNNSDPARTASDTRKGVAHLEALRSTTTHRSPE